MSVQSTAGIALAGVAVFQAILNPWLARTEIATKAYRKMMQDGTKNFPADGITGFFHDKEAGGPRVDVIVDVATLASRVTSQLSALVTAIIALGVIAYIAYAAGWAFWWTTIVAIVVALVFLGVLGYKISKGELRDFRMHGAKWSEALSTPAPYATVVLCLAVFAAGAGLLLG